MSNKSAMPGHPLFELTRSRFLEFVRDRSAIFWVFIFPMLLAVALGIAFRNSGPEEHRVAIIGPGAEALVARMDGAKNVIIDVRSEQEAARALRTGRIDLVIELGIGNPPQVAYRLDPLRPGAQAVRYMVDDSLQRAFGRKDPVEIREVRVEEKGGRYIDFLIPGLIGLNIMGSCMWGLGYAIVDSRRRKLLKRFAATPMHRAHFLLAFMLSRFAFLFLEVFVLTLFGKIVFGVDIQGSMLGIAAIAVMGAFAFSGLSLLIASRTESTEAASGWMNFVQMPMWLLSGSFFAYDRFPEIFHPAIQLLPLTAINDGLRAIINDGASLTDVLVKVAVLAAWGLLTFAIALRVFRWQ